MEAKSSWKDKIDPAFDRIIKFYLNIFDHVGIPANTGWLSFDDIVIKAWMQKKCPAWLEPYEKEVTGLSKGLMTGLLKKGITEKERQKIRRKFYKELTEEIKILPEDSRQYYLKLAEPYYTDDLTKINTEKLTPKEWLERLKDFMSDMFPLTVHGIIHEIEKENKELGNQELPKKYLHPDFMLPVIASMYNVICLLVFEKGLLMLLREARDGNRESFFNLIQIDRSVICCDWAAQIIRKAQLEADMNFFKDMAKSIATSPLENTKIYGQAILVLLMFWDLGMKKLTYREMVELLEDCGIRLQVENETFARFVRRLNSIDRSHYIKIK